MKPSLGITAITVVMMLLTARVQAEVRDDGNFFSTDVVQKANTATEQLRRDTGKDFRRGRRYMD